MRFGVGRIDNPDLASCRDADYPGSDAVGIQRVLPGAIVACGEHDGDAPFGNLLRRLVDRIVRLERARRAPGVVHHFDVVLLLMTEAVSEPGQRPEAEPDVSRADPDQVRPRP